MPEKDPKTPPAPPPSKPKICHRFMVPAVWQEIKEVPSQPLNPRSEVVQVAEMKHQLVHIGCRRDCAMFDAELGCLEVAAQRAQVFTAARLEELAKELHQLTEIERAGESA